MTAMLQHIIYLPVNVSIRAIPGSHQGCQSLFASTPCCCCCVSCVLSLPAYSSVPSAAYNPPAEPAAQTQPQTLHPSEQSAACGHAVDHDCVAAGYQAPDKRGKSSDSMLTCVSAWQDRCVACCHQRHLHEVYIGTADVR